MRRGISSEFTLKMAEMQMSTVDSYQYSNNTTILRIWARERFRPSVWNWWQKKNEKEKNGTYWCSIFDWQKVRNNERSPDTAKLRWKAMLSVLDGTFGCFYKISRKQIVC